MTRDEFILEVKKLGISVSDSQLLLLDRYYELLISFNEKINLTAITKREDVFLKHFYDSLTLCRVIDFNGVSSLCDVGTGAGFPGIVIKIFFPHLKLTLVDALNKRIKFLETVCLELGLSSVTLVHARAEEYALKNREMFDVVTARAVAALPVLLEYCLPLVKVSSYFVSMKGVEDVSTSSSALNVLGGKIECVDEFVLPYEESSRMLIKVRKEKKTSNKYPRRFAEIKKRPL